MIRVIVPGICNVSNGFTVIWLFGQVRWSSCNKLALFSDLSDYHLFGALLEPSLPSRVEREETFNTPLFMGGLGGPGCPARPLAQRKHTQQGGVPVQWAG
jgi:hypothetical protein